MTIRLSTHWLTLNLSNLKRGSRAVITRIEADDPHALGMIVREDVPVEWAVQQALFGRLLNTGQCCVGTKRLIVVGKERAQIVEAALARIFAKIPAGDPGDRETKLGPLASARAAQTLKDQVDRAIANNASIEASNATLSAARRITPHVTAIVTVADDGGSSGRLRSELDVVPPGDLRMALAALASDSPHGPWSKPPSFIRSVSAACTPADSLLAAPTTSRRPTIIR